VVDRASPVFSRTVMSTLPLPVPDAPRVIDTHDEFSLAAHEHPAPAVTVTFTEKLAPAAGTFSLVGAIENAHAAAACVTVAMLPLIVTVAVREPPVFGPTLNATVPLPAPELPLVMTSQLSLGVAVHVHCGAVSTATVPLPPLAGTDCAPGRSVQLHGTPGSGVGGAGVGGPGVGVAALAA
jgi:hypothetical protein